LPFRCLLLTVIAAFLLTGCAELVDALPVVHVSDQPYPTVFDPYYNQPKIYRQPLLRINEQEDQRQQGVQDYNGEGRIRADGLQEHDLSQEEEKEIARDHEISFLALHPGRRKRIRIRCRLHVYQQDRAKL
jgi:hypothetical protein